MANVATSISITSEQKRYVREHPRFNLSKFIQLMLDDYINVAKMVEYDLHHKKEVKNGKKTIK